jgi:POT family proton-dependent oligopeptide transporter
MRGFAIGMWFITSALGIKLGSFIASLVANNSAKSSTESYDLATQIASFNNYEHLFRNIFLLGLSAAIIAWLLGGKLTRMINNK